MSLEVWTAALDEFAARLELQRCALGSEQPDSVPAFTPPATSGPIPAELRDRAEDLLEQSLDLQAEMDALLVDASREVEVVRRFAHSADGHAAGSYIDDAL